MTRYFFVFIILFNLIDTQIASGKGKDRQASEAEYLEAQIGVYQGEEAPPEDESFVRNYEHSDYEFDHSPSSKGKLLINDSFPAYRQFRGSCVGHAVSTAFSFEIAKLTHDVDFSNYKSSMVSNLSNPYWLWDKQIIGDGEKGANCWKALQILAYHGCPTIKALATPKSRDDSVLTWRPAYNARPRRVNENVVRDSAKYRLKKFGRLSTLSEIKSAIDDEHPVIMGIRCFRHFQFHLRHNGRTIWDRSHRLEDEESAPARENGGTNHAVLCIGYDDVNECLVFLNSWGSAWGDSGRFRVSYNLFEPESSPTFVAKKEDPLYFAGYGYIITEAEVFNFSSSIGESEIDFVPGKIDGGRQFFSVGVSSLPEGSKAFLFLDYSSFSTRGEPIELGNEPQEFSTVADMFIRIECVGKSGERSQHVRFADNRRSNRVK